MKYNHITFICLLYSLGICHLALFLYEFFPVRTKHHGEVVTPPSDINGTSLNPHKNYVSNVNRVIFMVIDGLRNDFINKTNTPFIHETLGCHITTKVESPTVTMPRIKAMTTGTLPQYIDILLNFQSVEVVEDSWLQRAKDSGKNIVFYGDNTWQKLFPDMFHRSEGTSSFFVTDFTEVDDNITRHINNELIHKKDWDILILHYLGLDHIGHIHGPFHPLVSQKLNEMDEIVQRIHSFIQKEDVVIISGDHGMRDLGGHGGSTDPEVLVPFIINKPCRKYRDYEIKQTDIAPTLSALMALPLPAQSVGKIIHDFLPYESDHQFLYFLHYNALNLLKMERKYAADFQGIFQEHVRYLEHGFNPKQLISSYEETIISISNDLLRSSSINQNVFILYVSICSLVLITLQVVFSFSQTVESIILHLINFIIILLFSIYRNTFITMMYSVVLSFSIVYACLSFKPFQFDTFLQILVFGTMFRTLSLISSSYIEFEQYIWWFLWSSVGVFAAHYKYKQKCYRDTLMWSILVIALRFARNIHLMNSQLYWIVFITGLIGLTYMTYKMFRLNLTITTLISLVIFFYRYNFQNIETAQFVKCLICLVCLMKYVKDKDVQQTVIVGWILWGALLMRPQNVILITICLLTNSILFKLNLSVEILSLMHIWLEEVLFYCQGFDNNFSSVDISPGYVGLSKYNFLYTSFQVVSHTYVFRVLPLLLLFCGEKRKKQQDKILHIYMMYRLTSYTYYCFVILIHRHHLFIWSVFSPKLLIESCHALCLFIMILYLSCIKSNTNNIT